MVENFQDERLVVHVDDSPIHVAICATHEIRQGQANELWFYFFNSTILLVRNDYAPVWNNQFGSSVESMGETYNLEGRPGAFWDRRKR